MKHLAKFLLVGEKKDSGGVIEVFEGFLNFLAVGSKWEVLR